MLVSCIAKISHFGRSFREKKKFWEEFLDLYESMPCLWKIKSSEYCNRELKNQCYKKLIEKLYEIDPDANRDKVVKKINIFRTNYKRDLRKVRKSGKSGAGAEDIFESSMWYFDKLHFLEEQECSREGKCTMDTESMETEPGDEKLEKPPHKKPKLTDEDNLLKIACQKLTSSDDSKSGLAKGWETQYEELSKAQKVYARTIFSDVLFHGCLEKLTGKTVEDIHKVLKGVSAQSHTSYLSRTSTPYIDEYNIHSSQSCSSSSVQHFEDPLYSPPLEQTQIFFRPVVQQTRPVITNHQVLATERIQAMQSPIAEFVTNFVDE